MEILSNLGFDVRILELEDAKDPDEFVVKFGSARFEKQVQAAISFVEFKIKILTGELNLENTNDKIKFLNEIAKILTKVDNRMEQEIYIEKISQNYRISKEAIYAEVNKKELKGAVGIKILEKPVTRQQNQQKETISKAEIAKENMVISLLTNCEENLKSKIYEEMKQAIRPDDFNYLPNQKILTKLYEEYEKGNYTIGTVLDFFGQDEEIMNQLSEIMTEDLGNIKMEKAVKEIICKYKTDKLKKEKEAIKKKLREEQLDENEKIGLIRQSETISRELKKGGF